MSGIRPRLESAAGSIRHPGPGPTPQSGSDIPVPGRTSQSRVGHPSPGSDPPVPDPGSPDLLDQPDNLCSHAFTTSLGHADEEIAIKFDVVVVGGFVVLQLEARHERREGKVEFRIGKAVIGSVS